MEIIPFKEHGTAPDDYRPAIDTCLTAGIEFNGNPQGFGATPRYLGLSQDSGTLRASMYIGAQWIIEGAVGATVMPKFDNTDYVAMMSGAMEAEGDEADYFSNYYGIDFDKPSIPCPQISGLLAPLLIVGFLSVMKPLVSKGLRHKYVYREENLKSKIKGHLLVSANFRLNEICRRRERAYCRFTEFSVDTHENRLLKRALMLSRSYIGVSKAFCRHQHFHALCGRMLTSFDGVGNELSLSEAKKVRGNKLFREYSTAIEYAKRILQFFDNSPAETSQLRDTTPPFWIDMPRLYELYVLSRLRAATESRVYFQLHGYKQGNIADFVIRDLALILDAKYRGIYGTSFDRDDIRELSCYSRDETLLPGLPEDYAPRCIIIYPGDSDDLASGLPVADCGRKINGYRNFYRVSIPLPTL